MIYKFRNYFHSVGKMLLSIVYPRVGHTTLQFKFEKERQSILYKFCIDKQSHLLYPATYLTPRVLFNQEQMRFSNYKFIFPHHRILVPKLVASFV